MRKPRTISLEEFGREHFSPKRIKQQYDTFKAVMESNNRLMKYLGKNNLTTDDLIAAHKKLKKSK